MKRLLSHILIAAVASCSLFAGEGAKPNILLILTESYRTSVPLFLILVIACTVLLGNLCAGEDTRQQKPNILFILVDDLGWADVGYQNTSIKVTPQIDRLAKEGVVFGNAYAAPVCSPSRAEIMTGRSPATLKLTSHIPGVGFEAYYKTKLKLTPKSRLWEAEIRDHLPLDEVTIAEVLKQHGYKTGFFGKWHLAGTGSQINKKARGAINPAWHPQHQGFDVNLGGCAYGQPAGKAYFSPYENAELTDGPKGEYLTDRLTDETIAFMKASKDAPFFAFLSYYTIHMPLNPKPSVSKTIRNKYMAMLKCMDDGVGKVLAAVDELGIRDNTLIIFTSDNGGIRTQKPLRGRKGTLYEGGIRVPLIYRWPARIKAHTTIDTPVAGADFFPTILDAVGITVPADAKRLDGRSYWAAIAGEDYVSHPVFQHFPHHRTQRSFEGASSVRDGDWKLIWHHEKDTYALYNLKKDTGEKTDLAGKYPEKMQSLKKHLSDWLTKTEANMAREKKKR